MRRRPGFDGDPYGEPNDNARNQDDLDDLLRSFTTPLAPPPGTFEAVRRRARRRRWSRTGAVVLAGVIVLGAGIPVAVHLRNQPSNRSQVSVAAHVSTPPNFIRTSPAATPAATATGRTPTTLTGFRPTSVSFVTQDDGYLLGPAAGTHAALARTSDAGKSWTRLPSPPVDARDDSSAPATVRFANADVGFVFGQQLYGTADGGEHWSRLPNPGFIDDLATMQGKLWALVAHGSTVRLYTASVTDPVLRVVRAVPTLHGGFASPAIEGSASLAVYGSSVDVITAREFYSSADGVTWKAGTNPCPAQVDGYYVQSTSVAAWSPIGMYAVCGEGLESGTQTKQAYVSTDAGHGWLPVHKPTKAGYLRTLGAGSRRNVIIGQTRYGAQLSNTAGRSWTTPKPLGLNLSFVGFIDADHVVALADGQSRRFLASYDAGQTWVVTTFPR